MSPGSDPSCAIGVMAKVPRAGASKTRLCPPLMPEQAAALSAAFLRDTTENIARSACQAAVVGYAAYAPRGTEAIIRRHIAPETRCIVADGSPPMPAGVDGFGRCLLHAVQAMLALGHAAACVLSSDTPTLPTACLVRAAEVLLSPVPSGPGRIVLGACEDGGYYLLGVTASHADLFTDIAWSTSSVADATRSRALALGLDVIELDPWYDIDDAGSLATLLADTAGYAAPFTRAMVDRLGLRSLPIASPT